MKRSPALLIKFAVITSGLFAGLLSEIPGKHTLSANEFFHVQHSLGTTLFICFLMALAEKNR